MSSAPLLGAASQGPQHFRPSIVEGKVCPVLYAGEGKTCLVLCIVDGKIRPALHGMHGKAWNTLEPFWPSAH